MNDFKPSNKARFWLHILYPENMRDDWRDVMSDLLEVPYAYCIHDKDKSGHDGDRKVHVHLITAWTTGGQTLKRAWETAEQLALPGRTCSLRPRKSANISHSYDYLIHDTESAQKLGKHLYDVSERVTGNTFDIDRYIVLDSDEKLAMAKELTDFVMARKYKDAASAYVGICANFDDKYFEVYKANNAMIDRLCRGNYLRFERVSEAFNASKCAVCGSQDVIGSFKHEETGGRFWFCTKHQETAYLILEEYEEQQ